MDDKIIAFKSSRHLNFGTALRIKMGNSVKRVTCWGTCNNIWFSLFDW